MFNAEQINLLIRSRRSVFADQYVPGKKDTGRNRSAIVGECQLGANP